MTKNIPTVVITKMSPRWRPFQIFILGLYELERADEIRLKFRCDWFYRISTIMPDLPHLGGILHQMAVFCLKDSYNMEGYVENDGQRRTFCIDSADSPHCLDGEALERVNVYFKTQCPKDIDPQKGFRLTNEVWLPYCDHRHKDNALTLMAEGERLPITNLEANMHKIKPCVVGFRRLADGNSYAALNNGWKNYRKGALKQAHRKAMCYFGNALGPQPLPDSPFDLDNEKGILKYYPDLNHPNEKRGKIAQIMQTLGDQYDSRLINSGKYGDTSQTHNELIVPIEHFCAHISNFQYNYNVSGYRMSIPNRFMESFIVGTAIITDQLAVKWYLPFEQEVVETVEMGYLPINKVDWNKAKEDLINLPDIAKDNILSLYEKKWAPAPVARYMVQTILSSR